MMDIIATVKGKYGGVIYTVCHSVCCVLFVSLVVKFFLHHTPQAFEPGGHQLRALFTELDSRFWLTSL